MGSGGKWDELIFAVEAVHVQTPRALRVTIGGVDAWLPLSQIKGEVPAAAGDLVAIPRWLADEKGFGKPASKAAVAAARAAEAARPKGRSEAEVSQMLCDAWVLEVAAVEDLANTAAGAPELAYSEGRRDALRDFGEYLGFSWAPPADPAAEAEAKAGAEADDDEADDGATVPAAGDDDDVPFLEEKRRAPMKIRMTEADVLEAIDQWLFRQGIEREKGAPLVLRTVGPKQSFSGFFVTAKRRPEEATEPARVREVEEVECTGCKRPEGAANHVRGHIFVGWGLGWQLCQKCRGSTRVTVDRGGDSGRTEEVADPVRTIVGVGADVSSLARSASARFAAFAAASGTEAELETALASLPTAAEDLAEKVEGVYLHDVMSSFPDAMRMRTAGDVPAMNRQQRRAAAKRKSPRGKGNEE